MGSLEERIRSYARSQGAKLAGLAGPERLDGPPSLDPTYTMRGAKSIVSLAIPMEVNAIYEFLSKKSPIPHNIDQLVCNQKLHHIAVRVADHIRSLGYRAKAVPSNNSYRRSPDIFATHPSFSHRFGAIASGIGAQGLSGNVMTREFGAAVYLGTVVTSAELRSDPSLPPRYFVDKYCAACRGCEKACPSRMFESGSEEHVLLNGELHPRAQRRDIDLCNISCFGLHGLSLDQKWSSWGRHWISGWVAREPDPRKENIRITLLRKGSSVGDSTARYDLIRRIGSRLYPEEWIDSRKVVPRLEDLPEDEIEQRRIQSERIQKYLRVDIDNPNVLTCGQCALVCGPDIKESAKRLKMLREGGIVVAGKDGKTVIAKSFDEARAIREQFPFRISRGQRLADMLTSTILWARLYGGIEPRSVVQNWLYQRKLRRALRDRGLG